MTTTVDLAAAVIAAYSRSRNPGGVRRLAAERAGCERIESPESPGDWLGELAQIPPTGRTVDTPGVVVLTVGDGVVTGERHHWPPHWVFEQLGLVTVSAVPTGAVPTLAVIRS